KIRVDDLCRSVVWHHLSRGGCSPPTIGEEHTPGRSTHLAPAGFPPPEMPPLSKRAETRMKHSSSPEVLPNPKIPNPTGREPDTGLFCPKKTQNLQAGWGRYASKCSVLEGGKQSHWEESTAVAGATRDAKNILPKAQPAACPPPISPAEAEPIENNPRRSPQATQKPPVFAAGIWFKNQPLFGTAGPPMSTMSGHRRRRHALALDRDSRYLDISDRDNRYLDISDRANRYPTPSSTAPAAITPAAAGPAATVPTAPAATAAAATAAASTATAAAVTEVTSRAATGATAKAATAAAAVNPRQPHPPLTVTGAPHKAVAPVRTPYFS
ncbi:MAG: hypothetical protein BJ554DRAFT_6228, partial [Olpidium bornovanus]